MENKVWDHQQKNFVPMPNRMTAFLADIEAVCRKHGLSIAHEDSQGGFLVEEYKDENCRWLAAAAKNYEE